jgi:serine/threonine protein kinase
MVMPYMDHDLSGMLTNPEIEFSEGQVKCYMLQLLDGLQYLHNVCALSQIAHAYANWCSHISFTVT